MSAEKPTEEQPPKGEEQAEPVAEKKPSAAKKATPRKAPAEKSAAEAKSPAAKKPVAKDVADGGSGAAVEKPVRAAKTTARKTTAKKAQSSEREEQAAKSAEGKEPTAAKKPALKEAEEQPVAKSQEGKKPSTEQTGSEPSTAKAKEATEEAGEPVAREEQKPAAAAGREPETSPSMSSRRVVRAQARYVRTSARKARMVCGHLRGKSVEEARAILAFTPREVARDWSKLLESAVANAENNHELIEDDLLVREAYADEGPTIKRFRPRAQGRATPIRKRTSHLTITLTPKP
jgi:ribosomal protein L22